LREGDLEVMHTQFQLTVNDSMPQVTDSFPEQWPQIVAAIEARGGQATLRSRIIVVEGELFCTDGMMKIGDKLVSPWRYEAQVTVR